MKQFKNNQIVKETIITTLILPNKFKRFFILIGLTK